MKLILRVFPVIILTCKALAVNFTEPKVSWSKLNVQVCFAGHDDLEKSHLKDTIGGRDNAQHVLDFSVAEKRLIRDTINKNYTREMTGIYFSGWKDCKESPESDTYLFSLNMPSELFLGTASIGESGELYFKDSELGPGKSSYRKARGDKKAFVALNYALMFKKKTSREEDIKMIALHEFGHLAGLRHEHIGKPRPFVINGVTYAEDFNCNIAKVKAIEPKADSTKQESVYDSNSIMNYCFLYMLRDIGLRLTLTEDAEKPVYLFEDSTIVTAEVSEGKINYEVNIALSQGDVHALRCLYVYTTQEKQTNCHAGFDPKI